MAVSFEHLLAMSFAKRLLSLRKAKGYTQQTLADAVGMHLTQIKRYELGQSQPTLEAIRKIALALHSSADELVFDETERGPSDELRLQFEAVARMPPEERRVIKSLLEGMILKHEAKRWANAS